MIKKIVILLVFCVALATFSGFDTARFINEIIFGNTQSQNEINSKNYPVFERNRKVFIGMSEKNVKSQFGEPCDILKSEYGFLWNIFHEGFKNYIQVGIDNGKVVGIYTNSPDFSFRGISVGTPINDVFLAFENPATYIVKGDTKYITNSIDKNDSGVAVFYESNMYITVFYDIFKNNSVTSINIIDYNTEQSFDRLFAASSAELSESFEKLNIYVTNALRVREGYSVLESAGNLSEIALTHSEEMAENEYFDHTDLSGGNVSDRADAARIKYKKIGENIAMGAQNSIYMHELLMNSEGHRKNILGDFSHIGTGVAFSPADVPYLTQNFLR